MSRPSNVGIKAIQVYVPNQYVDQSDLEVFDGVGKGKYTIGLGQTKMGFVDDREDIYSISLTVLKSLLETYNISPLDIGRLEVGTETIIDKSKSCKSVLMSLFKEAGNNDVEGVDTLNACYGGTNALFNSCAWIESSNWDGRLAVVVAADIALYAKGPARPTGGAGAVAMLIGPDAPITLEPGLRGTYMDHVYDFYKPDMSSEYPIVNGHYSVECYTRALDNCYKTYLAKFDKVKRNSALTNGTHKANIDVFDFCVFHSPTCKTVQKAYGRMLYNDIKAHTISLDHDFTLSKEEGEAINACLEIPYDKSFNQKDIERTFIKLSNSRFNDRVAPSFYAPTNTGNIYTGSLYLSFAALLTIIGSDALQSKRVGLYSFGAGLASTLFSLRINGDISDIVDKMGLKRKIEGRARFAPEKFNECCELRKAAHLQKDFTPKGSIDNLSKGTYYLEKVDEQYRRQYARKE